MSSRRMPPAVHGVVIVLSLIVVAGLAVLGITGIEKARGAADPATAGATPSGTARATGSTRAGHWITRSDPAPTSPTSTTPTAPSARPVVTSKTGAAVTVLVDDSRYNITVSPASWQPAASWDGSAGARRGGFLIVPVSVTRLDGKDGSDLISYSQWKLGGGKTSEAPIDAELIGGSYVQEFSTVSIAPGETQAGNVVFDTAYRGGTLELSDRTGVIAKWELGPLRKIAVPPTAAVGAAVHSEVARVPFDATISTAKWFPASDPAVGEDLDNDHLLLISVTVTPDVKAIGGDERYIGPGRWQFTAKGHQPARGHGGSIGRQSVGELELTAHSGPDSTQVMFDAPGVAGTVELIGLDHHPVMRWRIPGP